MVINRIDDQSADKKITEEGSTEQESVHHYTSSSHYNTQKKIN
jgi:hypothetical protein